MAGPSRWRRRAALADGGEGCHPSRTPRPRGRRSARGGTTEAGRRPATARAVQCSFLALHHRRPGRPHKPASRAGSAENPDARAYITEDLGYSEAPVCIVEDGTGEDHWSGFRPDNIKRVARASA